MPAQLMFGNSDVNSRGSGLPLVALRSLAMQASISRALSLVQRASVVNHRPETQQAERKVGRVGLSSQSGNAEETVSILDR